MTEKPTDVMPDTSAPNLFVLLRELGDLRYDGILSEDEFAAKRAEIFARIRRQATRS